jgi:hypothetical protein
MGILAIRMHDISAARRLFVVERGAALHTAPALDSDARSRLDAGDIAAADAVQGAWTHVRLDGDREGWIEGARLVGLSDTR